MSKSCVQIHTEFKARDEPLFIGPPKRDRENDDESTSENRKSTANETAKKPKSRGKYDGHIESKEFWDFLANPDLYDNKLDRDELDNVVGGGKYYNLEKQLSFTIDFPRGLVAVEAYFNDGEFVIHGYGASPEREGYGTAGIRLLEKLLGAKDIGINVVDQIDESVEFWNKVGY